MNLKVYNTLTKEKELFAPAEPGKVKIYVCGVTPYNHPHIGNARPFIIWDVIHRYFERQGLSVTHIQNFTDVDDKIIDAAAKAGIAWNELADRYIKAYFEVMDSLNVRRVDLYPRVSGHMQEIIDMVRTLVEKGHAYVVDGDVYFSVQDFATYGHLSGRSLDDMKAGARVEVDDRKRHPMDFALWKSAKPGEPFWDSPWGPGRPGWHIECSAMSHKYLGCGFDFHGGGSDLIFPHHENEVAQSRCACGGGFARLWFHITHLLVDGGKMSKSLGNMYTLADLDKLGHRPSAVRYVLAGGYYRRPLNFTLSSLEDAKAALNRLSKFDMQLRNASGTDSVPSYEEFCAAFPELGIFQPAWDSLNDDLNTPEALGHVFSAIRKADIPSLSPEEAARLRNAFHFILAAFGIILPEEGQEEAPEEIRTLADQRWQAKQNRDWTEADRLRAEVAALGWVIKDRKDGYDLARK